MHVNSDAVGHTSDINWRLDWPGPDDRQTPYGLSCSGWFHIGEEHDRVEAIALFWGEHPLCISRALRRRDDVNNLLGFEASTRTGFHLFGNAAGLISGRPAKQTFSLAYRLENDDDYRLLGYYDIRVVDSDVGAINHPYGILLARDFSEQFGRKDIYTTGPPEPMPDELCLQLLTEILDPGTSVLDIGCGAGAYGQPLMDAGHTWLGIELDAEIANQATEAGLPVLVANATDLDIADGAFDHVIAIEVVEHLNDPEALIRQAARLASRSVVFSVPNSTAIPLLHPYLVTPWHLMEGDHKSFFTPTNLTSLLRHHFDQVEVVPYGDLPIRTPEGVRIPNHLLAICWNEDPDAT